MRVLAYGGTMYAQRLCLGAWKVIPVEGALQDTYGLYTNSLTFGVGLLDGLPCLIVRLLQNSPPRIGYAYTLLLDPGEAVWEKFKWNGAELAYSLFEKPGALGRPLLTIPERYTEKKIEHLLSSLEPPSFSASGHRQDALLALLVGSADEAVPVVATPKAAGFAVRPGLKEVAAQLSSLPAALRNGSGWLIGGSYTNGRSFGVSFVLDDGRDVQRSETAQGAVNDSLTFGSKIIDAWNAVSDDPEYEGVILERVDVPLWQWQAKYGSTPQQFFARLLALAALLRPSELSDGALQAIDYLLLQPGELEKEIRQALRNALAPGSEKLKHTRTTLTPRDYLEGESSVKASDDSILQHVDVAQAEEIRLLLTSDDNIPANLTLDRLDETHQDTLLHQLLTGGSAEEDAHYRNVFFKLCGKGSNPLRWQTKVATVLLRCEEDPALCRTMLRRFMRQSESAERLIEALPETTARLVIALHARHEPEEFEERADMLYSRYLTGDAPSPYTRVSAHFLLANEGYEFKTRISNRYHGFFHGLLRTEKIDRNLSEIIGAAEESSH